MPICETVEVSRNGKKVIINKSDLTDKDKLAGGKKEKPVKQKKKTPFSI